MGVRLGYLHLILVHCKGQGRRHENFTSEYLDNGDKLEKHYYCSKIWKSYIGFLLSYLHFTLTHSKSQDQCLAHLECKYLGNVKHTATVSIAIKYEIIRGLSNVIFTFDLSNSKGQDQIRGHLTNNNLEK